MMKTLRMRSLLSDSEEELIRTAIACAIEVHRGLGPGLIENFYRRALCLEFESRGISFDTEHPVSVKYRGTTIGVHRLDFVVEKTIVLELKAVERLELVHTAQVISYLRASGLRAGLLLNFNAAPLTIRRIVL
jgi:GxxExxY protein